MKKIDTVKVLQKDPIVDQKRLKNIEIEKEIEIGIIEKTNIIVKLEIEAIKKKKIEIQIKIIKKKKKNRVKEFHNHKIKAIKKPHVLVIWEKVKIEAN